MVTIRVSLCALLALTAMACASKDTIEQQEADFRLWQQSKKCLVSKSLEPAIKMCVHGQGDLERGRKMVTESLRQWLDAVRSIHPGVTDKVEFTCESPHGYVRIRSGSGRAFACATATFFPALIAVPNITIPYRTTYKGSTSPET